MEKFKVLVVDDIPINVQAVSNVLKQEGYLVYFAKSGDIALQLVEKNNFDIILLDIMMPELDGYEVCKKLKENPKTKDVPVIFLTARTDPESIATGFDVGGTDYILKPFYNQELIARVKTHLKLKQQTNELKEINATKDKFFSIISHDLKNPFYGILSIGKILLEKIKTKNIKETENYAELMFQSAKHAYQLIENLFEWSQSQIGQINYNPEEINIKDIIEETIALFQGDLERKKIEFSQEVPKDSKVYADRNMLRVILRNLISNAIKFTENEGCIKVTFNQKDKLGEITISDNGNGIPIEDQQKLFKLNENYSTPDTEQKTGSGLGLILCNEFITKNKGHIYVKSEPGEGSEFSFTLPNSSL